MNSKLAKHHLQDVQQILDRDVSPDLRATTCLFLNRETLKGSPMFRSFGPASLAYLAPLLTVRHYVKGDYIVREGDDATSMYFVVKGECDVLCSRDHLGGLGGVAAMFSPAPLEVGAQLKHGDHFGEGALVGEAKRTASVVARTHCEVSELTVASLRRVLEKYPQEVVQLELQNQVRAGRKRLRAMLVSACDELLDAFQVARYLKGDVIAEGDLQRGAFLLCAGELEVCTRERRVVARLCEGDDSVGILGALGAPSLMESAAQFSLHVRSPRAVFMQLASLAAVDDKPLLLAETERHPMTWQHFAQMQERRSVERAHHLKESLSGDWSKQQIEQHTAHPWVSEMADLWSAEFRALTAEQAQFSLDLLHLLQRRLQRELARSHR